MLIIFRNLAVMYPEFVQWVVQKYGSLPEGQVKKDDYEKYLAEYLEEKNEAD